MHSTQSDPKVLVGLAADLPNPAEMPLGCFFYATDSTQLFLLKIDPVTQAHVWAASGGGSLAGLIHADGSVVWVANQSVGGFRLFNIGGLAGVNNQLNYEGGAKVANRVIAATGTTAGLLSDYVVSFSNTSAPSAYQAIAMGALVGQRVALIIQDTSFASAYGIALVNPITIHCLAGKRLNNIVDGTATITTGGGSASFLIDENDNMIQLGGA